MTALALVVARFYDEIADSLECRARKTAAEHATAQIVDVVPVPGVYDVPLAADRLARRAEIDAVAVLGAVITGDTDHDQVVAHTVAQQCCAISVAQDTPVTFGCLGPGMSAAEARERIEYGAAAVSAAIDMIESLPAP